MNKILCWLGVHDWTYSENFQTRSCVRCWRREEIVEIEKDSWRRGLWKLYNGKKGGE